ncbi:GNAT family N-acetyltransferase [Agrococcus jejuensis]|uniref:GNAT family N-acetyltransferase n=1 Tax=Agrococcus jejuensis TaxID=399736 RepID=UPI000B89E971|nr:GNAT family N-acetyltransferase [Agrococcus jejuensis]
MRADAAELAASGDVTLAWRGDALVGMIVMRMQADAVHVGTVAVAPSEQGSGLGSRLLALAEQRAVDAGTPVVRLFTNARMTENLAYYPRRGYVDTHRATDDGFDRVFFEKRL